MMTRVPVVRVFLLVFGGVLWILMFPLPGKAANKKPPPYNSSRYKEDYRYLRDLSQHTDYMDPIKYIPLSSGESVYLSFGGETRQHYEYTENQNWGSGLQDGDGWYLQRYLLHADLHLGDHVRLFGQVMSGIETGRNGGPRGVDEERLDLNQGFVDFKVGEGENRSLTVRLGRQEIIFGSRRFFNYRERPNMRLSHDGGMVIVKDGPWDVRAFASRPVDLNKGYFDNNSSDDFSVWGLYTVRALEKPFPTHVDLYYFGLDHERGSFDQGTAQERRHAVGTRWWGKGEGWDYNFEFMYQFGTFGTGDIGAWAVASDTGYTFRLGGPRTLRLSLRADIYTGDRDRNDADLNSFNPFFPKGKHISQLAAAGLTNQRNLHPRITAQVSEHWSVTVSDLFIWRDSLNDGLYSIGNGVLFSGGGSRARYVGHQPELEIKWQADRHMDIKWIFVYFVAGDFLKEVSPGKDITYLSTMLTYRF